METTQVDKQELKHWIDRIDDEIILLMLQSLKKAESLEDWFWDKIPSEQKQSIIKSLQKAKKNDTYTQGELWAEIEYQYSPENLKEEYSEGLAQALKRGMEDIKAGRVYTSEEVWQEIERRRKQRTE
jgi:hypothetical protein